MLSHDFFNFFYQSYHCIFNCDIFSLVLVYFIAWPPVNQFSLTEGCHACKIESEMKIDDCAKDGGAEFFTEMHCVL